MVRKDQVRARLISSPGTLKKNQWEKEIGCLKGKKIKCVLENVENGKVKKKF